MLFPLNQNIQSENIQPIDHVNDSVELVDTSEVVKEISAELAIKEQPNIQGLMTCSRTRQLMKANILMSQMFDQDFTFVPRNYQTEKQTSGFSFKERILSFIFNLVSNC